MIIIVRHNIHLKQSENTDLHTNIHTHKTTGQWNWTQFLNTEFQQTELHSPPHPPSANSLCGMLYCKFDMFCKQNTWLDEIVFCPNSVCGMLYCKVLMICSADQIHVWMKWEFCPCKNWKIVYTLKWNIIISLSYFLYTHISCVMFQCSVQSQNKLNFGVQNHISLPVMPPPKKKEKRKEKRKICSNNTLLMNTYMLTKQYTFVSLFCSDEKASLGSE